MKWLIALIVTITGCSSGSGELVPDALTQTGGCGMVSAYAADTEWTQVLDISVRRDVMVAAGAAAGTAVNLDVGREGVFVRFDEGRNLRNLYCNDFLEGNEEMTTRRVALSGTIRIELERPIDEEFECCDESQTAIIRATGLTFDGSEPFDISFPAHIGWYPG